MEDPSVAECTSLTNGSVGKLGPIFTLCRQCLTFPKDMQYHHFSSMSLKRICTKRVTVI